MVVIKHTSGVKPKKLALPTAKEIDALRVHDDGWLAKNKRAFKVAQHGKTTLAAPT